jgi:broad specificity phosphatase PhoE
MQIFLIRHGDPDYSIDDLTEFGHQEAAALGKRMGSIGLDELYASPLGRAQTTASYVAKETGLVIQTEPWTCELDWEMSPTSMLGV